MFILEVIPLTTLPQNAPQLLSYFHDRELPKGAIVEIAIGNRKVMATVVASTSLQEKKIFLKKTTFQLKKVSSVVSEEPRVSGMQFKLALWLAKNYYAPLGLALKTALPPFFLKTKNELRTMNYGEAEIKLKLILAQAKDFQEIAEKQIEENIKNQKQTLLVFPDITISDHFYQQFKDKHPTVNINSRISRKEYRQSWGKVASGEAKVAVGTRLALFLPFNNLGTLILEDPYNEAYKSYMAPRYHGYDLAKKVAQLYGSKLLAVAGIPNVSDFHEANNGRVLLIDKRSPQEPAVKIVDMFAEFRKNNFSPISQELAESIRQCIETGRKVLIFSPRKGYSGSFLCQNCGWLPKCLNCDVALRVHRTTEFILVCHHCVLTKSLPKYCPNCNSYKFRVSGPPGSQKIFDEFRRLMEWGRLKRAPVLILDNDTVKNPAEEWEIMETVRKDESLILIATQKVFSHRHYLRFGLVGVINTDSLVSMPDYTAAEELLSQVAKLRDFQPQYMIFQVHDPQDKSILSASQNDFQSIYEEELPARQALLYPPFARLVKLTFRHKDPCKARSAAMVLAEKLRLALLQLHLSETVLMLGPSDAFFAKERGHYAQNIILKILPSLLRLEDILKFIPAGWTIDVDSKSLL